MVANGESPSPAAPGLEQQIAALAAQVRNLGVRLAAGAGGRNPGRGELPDAPPPRRSAEAAPAQDTTAEQAVIERLRTTAVPSARILAMAEAAAAEIRANATLEAERIREAAANASRERLTALLEIVARQSDGVAALSAELDRVEASTAALRAQANALDSELQGMLVALSSVSRSVR
jgi:hypothetical protein